MLWFKSKEQKEKELEIKKQEAKIEQEYKEKASIEVEKIIKVFEDFKNERKYHSSIYYYLDDITDEKLKICIMAQLLDYYYFGNWMIKEDLKNLLNNKSEKCEYYDKFLCSKKVIDEFYPKEDYFEDNGFKDSYYVKHFKFQHFKDPFVYRVFKNCIELSVDNRFSEDNTKQGIDPYDRSGLLMNR